MPPAELRHTHADDLLAALFVRRPVLSTVTLTAALPPSLPAPLPPPLLQVPAIDVCEWRRRTVHHGTKLAGAAAPPHHVCTAQ